MNITIERILNLMQTNNVNAAKLHTDCNLSNSSVTKWRKGELNPSTEAVVKIADYFGVSVDYLLGRTDNPHPSDYIAKNNIPIKVLKLWDNLTPNEITVISDLIERLVNAHPQD